MKKTNKKMIKEFKKYVLEDIEKIISKHCEYIAPFKVSVGYTKNEIKGAVNKDLFYYSEHFPTDYKSNFKEKVKYFFHTHITKKAKGFHEAFCIYLDGIGEAQYYDFGKCIKKYNFYSFVKEKGYSEKIENGEIVWVKEKENGKD